MVCIHKQNFLIVRVHWPIINYCLGIQFSADKTSNLDQKNDFLFQLAVECLVLTPMNSAGMAVFQVAASLLVFN